MNYERLPEHGYFALLIALSIGCGPLPALVASELDHGGAISPSECLVLKPAGEHGRVPIHVDEIEAKVVKGEWKAPRAGDMVTLNNKVTKTWAQIRVGQDGFFSDPALQGGYGSITVHADKPGIFLLEASGHNMVYVNGEPRIGDPYQSGFVKLPVSLRAGDNGLLFHVRRGKFKVRLVRPPAPLFLNPGDTTLPDLIGGEQEFWASIVVVNASNEDLTDLAITTQGIEAPRSDQKRVETVLPVIHRLGVRKVGFRVSAADIGSEGKRRFSIELRKKAAATVLDSVQVELRIRRPDQIHKRTFVSKLDDSVQYYAVNPARPASREVKSAAKPALFLTLHGAGVEALGQVEAYSPKSWGHLVAPTNRRPFGFDWEDWGRLDALEVLELAERTLATDLTRTYLTGHSMGGHGTWHLGGTYPDKFAAIGPSAGWITMWTYGSAPRSPAPSPLEAILQRATNPEDTIALTRNYLHHGVYILHGSADDNVPVDQARLMRDQLRELHPDFVYYEQPKAGHWWDDSDEPGADCVDWAPMFDFFAHHVIPADDGIRQVDFMTFSPGVSARSHWLTIEDQLHPGRLSSARIRLDPGLGRFSGKTMNVARLSLDLSILTPAHAVRVELDGEKLPQIEWPAGEPRLWLQKHNGKWQNSTHPAATTKGPQRYGPFKEAFRNRVQFVYGTQGNAEENSWAFAKARFDAENLWYRGNGSIDVIPDSKFDTTAEKDRNVVLYGNADTNLAWKPLLGTSSVQVRRGEIILGKYQEKDDGLGCLFILPRPGTGQALVGVVTGTGVSGMRLTDRLPYFLSGVGYPDLIVLTPDVLKRGLPGVRLAGYFDSDWSLAHGEFLLNK